MSKKALIIIGDSAFAEVAYEYFTHDSEYQVVAFCVEKEFIKNNEKFGLPIISLEEIDKYFSPSTHSFYAALVYTQINRLRERLYLTMKAKGYAPASYISSRSFLWRNVAIGEHCFIFEDNTIQPFVSIGNNVVLWSGNHIGHHSHIHDNCFISSHVVISGFCEIGSNSFLGVNASIANNIAIGSYNWVGPGISIVRNTQENAFYKSVRLDAQEYSTTDYFKLESP
jgi:sugar O-acyltransferase (sialic acid O-acetyltransferase NeuD family)